MELNISTTIGRPAPDVFRFVAIDHARNHPRWDPALVDFRQVGEGPVQAGTRFDFRTRVMGRMTPMRMEVTAFEPDRRMAFDITSPSGTLAWQLLVEPVNQKSARLTSTGNAPFRGPMRLFEPLIRRQLVRSTREGQARIKSMLEAGG